MTTMIPVSDWPQFTWYGARFNYIHDRSGDILKNMQQGIWTNGWIISYITHATENKSIYDFCRESIIQPTMFKVYPSRFSWFCHICRWPKSWGLEWSTKWERQLAMDGPNSSFLIPTSCRWHRIPIKAGWCTASGMGWEFWFWSFA